MLEARYLRLGEVIHLISVQDPNQIRRLIFSQMAAQAAHRRAVLPVYPQQELQNSLANSGLYLKVALGIIKGVIISNV